MNRVAALLIVVIIILLLGIFIPFNNLKIWQKPSSSNSLVPTSQKPIGIPANTFRISITDQGFSPKLISIKKNDTIIWINQSKNDISINSDPHPTHNLYSFLNLGKVAPKASINLSFHKEGTYTYHNHLNPSQTGTIVVRPQ